MSRRAPPRPPRATLLTCLVIALPVWAELFPEEPDLDWIDRTQLAAGEVLIGFGEDSRFKGRIDVAVLVEAPPEDLWTVLRDCEVAPEYVDNILRCELIDTVDGGRSELYLQEVRFARFLPRFEHVFRLDYEPYERIDVHKVSGPFRTLEGRWWLVPETSDNTLLIYSLAFQPGAPVPRFVVGAALRRDLPKILNAVRERAERAP